jgi:DNA-binding CsgD family transcriptional regulator
VVDDPLPHVGYATALTDILLKLGRLQEVFPAAERLDLTWTDPIRYDLQTSVLRLNVFEALTELGDTQGAAIVIDPVTVGTPQPHTWFVYAARARLEMLRGNLSVSEERWAALPRAVNPDDVYEIEPWRLELKLWLRQPREALVHALDLLGGLVDSSDTRPTGRLLLMAVRALADLGRWPTKVGTQPSTPKTAETLKSLHSSMVDDPLRLGPLRPTGDADGLLWRAEWARAHREGDSVLWEAAAEAYEQHHRPHVAAYARWRQAEALLLEDGRALATPVLQHADRLALQHVPLRAAVAKLATRAHISLDDPASHRDAAVPHPFGLTSREMMVLELLCQGYTNAKIGSELFISEKTASVHVSNILRKLDVSSRVEAAVVAEQFELLSRND